MDFEQLRKKFGHIVNFQIKEERGEIYIDLTQFNINHMRDKREELQNYVVQLFLNMLEVNKEKKEIALMYVNMENIKKHNFSLGYFKKVNRFILDNIPEDEDVTGKIIVLGASKLIMGIWNIVKPFIHRDTVKKFVLMPKKKN